MATAASVVDVRNGAGGARQKSDAPRRPESRGGKTRYQSANMDYAASVSRKVLRPFCLLLCAW